MTTFCELLCPRDTKRMPTGIAQGCTLMLQCSASYVLGAIVTPIPAYPYPNAGPKRSYPPCLRPTFVSSQARSSSGLRRAHMTSLAHTRPGHPAQPGSCRSPGRRLVPRLARLLVDDGTRRGGPVVGGARPRAAAVVLPSHARVAGPRRVAMVMMVMPVVVLGPPRGNHLLVVVVLCVWLVPETHGFGDGVLGRWGAGVLGCWTSWGCGI